MKTALQSKNPKATKMTELVQRFRLKFLLIQNELCIRTKLFKYNSSFSCCIISEQNIHLSYLAKRKNYLSLLFQ